MFSHLSFSDSLAANANSEDSGRSPLSINTLHNGHFLQILTASEKVLPLQRFDILKLGWNFGRKTTFHLHSETRFSSLYPLWLWISNEEFVSDCWPVDAYGGYPKAIYQLQIKCKTFKMLKMELVVMIDLSFYQAAAWAGRNASSLWRPDWASDSHIYVIMWFVLYWPFESAVNSHRLTQLLVH